MEYHFDIDFKVGGKTIVDNLPCKAGIEFDRQGEWYIDEIYIEAMDGSFVKADGYMEDVVRNELKTWARERDIHLFVTESRAAA